MAIEYQKAGGLEVEEVQLRRQRGRSSRSLLQGLGLRGHLRIRLGCHGHLRSSRIGIRGHPESIKPGLPGHLRISTRLSGHLKISTGIPSHLRISTGIRSHLRISTVSPSRLRIKLEIPGHLRSSRLGFLTLELLHYLRINLRVSTTSSHHSDASQNHIYSGFLPTMLLLLPFCLQEKKMLPQSLIEKNHHTVEV